MDGKSVAKETEETLKLKVNKLKEEMGDEGDSIINVNAKNLKKTPECIVLDRLNLNMYCCRRIMLGHVAIGDKI